VATSRKSLQDAVARPFALALPNGNVSTSTGGTMVDHFTASAVVYKTRAEAGRIVKISRAKLEDFLGPPS